jgi:hypothetical protein
MEGVVMKSRKALLAIALVVTAGIAVGGFALFHAGGEKSLEVNRPSVAGGDDGAGGESRQASAEYVMVGGVRRRASDLRRPEPSKKDSLEGESSSEGGIRGYGKTSPIPLNANPNVKSVVEAIRDKKHPERLTPMVAPALFDAKAFAANPRAYLDVVEPGRAFAPAQPGKNVPRMKPLSPHFQRVEQGGSVKLQVTGKPKMPVTFTSLDLGQFSNQLTSITVVVNDQGIAEAEFFATPGTIDDVRVVAASPATSGQASFIVNVNLPSAARR